MERELRLPEEVFSVETMKSFDLVPLTDSHPTEFNGGIITSKNFKNVTVGIVGNVKQNGNNLEAEINIADETISKKVLSGRQQLSCGYECDREKAPEGSLYNGVPYDYIQRNIRGNHVAVVPMGRAGPESRIHLDAEDAFLEESDATETSPLEIENEACGPEVKMTVVKLDNVDVEVPEVVAKELDKNKTDLETTRARLDAAEKELVKLADELKAANDVARIEGLVKSRVALETKARTAAPDVKLDGLTELEIKKAVITKLDGEISLEGKSPEAVDAYFDAATKYAMKRNVATEAAAKALETVKTEVRLDSELTGREKFYADWKKKTL